MDVTNKTDVTDTHSHKDDVQPNVSIHTAEAHTNGQPAREPMSFITDCGGQPIQTAARCIHGQPIQTSDVISTD